SSTIACSTRRRVSGSTFGLPFATRDTVCPDTPARAATIAIDTRALCGIRPPPSLSEPVYVAQTAPFRATSGRFAPHRRALVLTQSRGSRYRVEVNVQESGADEMDATELIAGVTKRSTLLAEGRELFFFYDLGTGLGAERSADIRELDARPET